MSDVASTEETLSVRIDDGTLARIDRLAEGEMRTRSGMARVLLAEALAARGADPPHAAAPDGPASLLTCGGTDE
jgi:hypothetical protein